MTRIVALGLAGILAVATLTPAAAATRKHHAAPAQTEQMDDGILSAPVAAAPHAYAVPAAPGFGPNACVSDEGYGRFTSCDSGTSN
jgi:hypothetical protein